LSDHFCPFLFSCFPYKTSSACVKIMNDDLQKKISDAIANPQNMGELANADAIGTVGSSDCGEMLRMWVKFKDENGKKVIDRATFQSFGCETAIAVAPSNLKALCRNLRSANPPHRLYWIVFRNPKKASASLSWTIRNNVAGATSRRLWIPYPVKPRIPFHPDAAKEEKNHCPVSGHHGTQK